MNKKLIIVDDDMNARRANLELLLAQMGEGEKIALLRLPEEPIDSKIAAGIAEMQAHVRDVVRPRAPHDRGTGGRVRPKEGLLAMMTRVAAIGKPRWTPPSIEERRICDNCDGAPDGGHTGDEFCRLTLDEI